MLHFLVEIAPDVDASAVRAALGEAVRGIPAIADQPLSSFDVPGVGAVAWVAHADRVLAPCAPVHETAEQVTLFSGLPLSTDGSGSARSARNLQDDLFAHAARLEGAYVLVRGDRAAGKLEIVNDFIGFCQLYQADHAGRTWLATTAAAIAGRMAPSDVDPLACADFCTTGWVMGDRTLDPRIKAVEGGTHLAIDTDRKIQRRRHCTTGQFAHQSVRNRLGEDEIRELRESLQQIVKSAASSASQFLCPITAGRDSRLLVGLTISTGVKTEYFTTQSETSPDVIIGRQLAAEFDLDYEVRETPVAGIAERFPQLAERLNAQTDGLRAMDAIRYLAAQPDAPSHTPVLLNGHGGEICRSFFASTKALLPGASLANVLDGVMGRMMMHRGEMLRREAKEHLHRHLQSEAEKWIAMGFRTGDVPDLIYGFDRVRRWAGTHRRVFEPAQNVVAPLVSRPFFDAAFRYSARARLTEPLHYRLMKAIDPRLHSITFEKGGWPLQNGGLLVASRLIKHAMLPILRARYRRKQRQRTAGQPHAKVAGWIDDLHASLVESHLATLREFNLDQQDSPVWEFVDRQEFDTITKSTDPAQRRRLANTILIINNIHFQRQRQLQHREGVAQ